MKKVLSVISILFIVSNVLYSDFYTGNELLSMLEESPMRGGNMDIKAFGNQALAIGYILGVYDAYIGIYSLSPGITSGQVRDIGEKYLKDHPKERHFSASILLLDAFIKAFPPIKDLKEPTVSQRPLKSWLPEIKKDC